MAKFVFDNCCFCVDLRVGCFIIGYLHLIFIAIASILSIMIVAGGGVLAASVDEDEKNIGTVVLVMGIIMLLMVAVLLAFAIVLLVGLHKHKPGHVKAYLIYSDVFLVISLILLIINLAKGPYDGGDITIRVLGLSLHTYSVMVIRSYYYQMLESNRSTSPQPLQPQDYFIKPYLIFH